MAGFLAYIIPVDTGAHPEHPIAPGGQPPGIWPSPGYPAHPIAPGGSPPGIWPGPGPLPHPEHPIAPGGRPPGIWGGGNEPFPTPPIVIPPQKPGDPPLVIWGGGNQPFPTPPIELPGEGGEPPSGGPPVRLVEWHTAWTEETGWVIVGTPNVPHPSPSKK